MDKKIKISELPEFDATRYLEDEQDIAMYLTCVLEENDAALLAAALGDIAKARGMTEVAKKAGIDRSHATASEWPRQRRQNARGHHHRPINPNGLVRSL